MTRMSNRAGYWKTALSPLLADIHQTIIDEIEGPSARLELGAALLTAKLYMLDYIARNDPDEMVFETFHETVEQNTPSKFKMRDWATKLTMHVRGGTKGRTGMQLEAFNEAQFALAYLLKFYKPVEDPKTASVLDFIKEFPGAEPGSPNGFNAVRLAWDSSEKERLDEEDRKLKAKQDEEDARRATEMGFVKLDGEPDVEAWRADQQAKHRAEQQTETRERLNQEIQEIIPGLVEHGTTIVTQPEKDGAYYFWCDEQWHRLKDSIRDRMILRGGRAGRDR